MQFNFVANQAMSLAFVRGDPEPLGRVLEALPDIPPDAAWVNFVRNHDELTLDKLSQDERKEVFDAFGKRPAMQIYGRGLRRRLPSMVEGDERRIRLAYSLMFSLPGTPALLYGEEIGMRENLDVDGRLAVRPPMQWSAEEHAGFAPPGTERLVRPVAGDYEGVNVADQRRDSSSLLNWMERLIRRRRECPEIGWGRVTPVKAPTEVLAHRCDWRGATVLALHNFADHAVSMRLRLDDLQPDDELLDLLGDEDARTAGGTDVESDLGPYGYRWLRVRRAGQRVLP